jgi:hypothetical protein
VICRDLSLFAPWFIYIGRSINTEISCGVHLGRLPASVRFVSSSLLCGAAPLGMGPALGQRSSHYQARPHSRYRSCYK